MLLLLRRLGMLCKKDRQPSRRIRVSHTILPDRINDLQSQQHVWIQIKKLTRTNCMFNSTTMSCDCGITSVDQFAITCNALEKYHNGL